MIQHVHRFNTEHTGIKNVEHINAENDIYKTLEILKRFFEHFVPI